MIDSAEDCDWSFGDHVPEGEPAPAQPTLDPRDYREGSVFGGCYEIKGRLGRGGMGVVYRALDMSSGREVAIKLLTQTLDSRARERFAREGELTAGLRHPGIVRVHAGGELQQTPYLVYELVEGQRTLVTLMKDGERDSLLLVLCLVADAVGYAHEHGVIHRDLKPENVLIDADGRPRVADFGLARAVGDSHLTRTGSLVGTPAFMSPEQVLGEHGRIGPASDVWALGVMLYTVLAGVLPFRASTLTDLSAVIVGEDPEPLRLIDSTLTLDLEAVCLKALRKRSDQRHPNAAAFAADLRRALERRSALDRSVPERLAAWSRGWPLPLAVAVVVLGVTLAAIFGPSHGREASPAEAQSSAASERALARSLAAKGSYREAAEAFARALEAGAAGEVAFERARALWKADEPEEAERVCRAALVTHRDGPGLALLARILLASGQAGFAEQTADDLAREHPGVLAEIVRAEVAEALGRDPEPILRAALKAWPQSIEPRLGLARSHLLRGEVFAARAVLAGARREASALRGLLDALLAHPPDVARLRAAPPSIRAACARWLLAEGLRDAEFSNRPQAAGALDLLARKARARTALQAALDLSQEGGAARLAGRAHLGLGLLAPAETDEAWSQAVRACEALPREPRALRLRAASFLARGDPARALEDLDAALALSSSEPARVELTRARAVLAAGGVPEPSPALEADPELSRALLTAARAAGRDAWAEALEERLEERAERRRRARLEFERRRLSGTLSPELCREALALDPTFQRARLTLGTQRFLRGEWLEGVRDALVAVEARPTDLSELCGQMLAMGWASQGMFGSRSLTEIVGSPGETPRGDEAALFMLSAAAEFEGKAAWIAPALARLSALLDRNPALLWPRVLRALLRARRGMLDDAEHELRVILEFEPALGVGWFGMAVVEVSRSEGSSRVRRHIAEAERLGFRIEQHKGVLASAYPRLLPHVGGR